MRISQSYKVVLFFAVALSISGCGKGVGIPFLTVGSSSDGGSGGGGSPNTGQLPHLLDPYAHRPSWSVAGVTYPVGTDGSLLMAPTTINQAGVTLNSTTQRVTVTASNTTLENISFGSWTVNIVGASNVTIKNCSFALTQAFGSYPAITSDANSPGTYIGHSVIDGGGALTAQVPPTLIALGAGGTVEYNWLKNSPSDLVDAAATAAGGTLMVQYNLMQNAGQLMNTDGSYITIGTGAFSSIGILYNTFYQVPGGQLGTGGINAVQPNGGSIGSLSINNNTIVATGAPGVLSFVIAAAPSQTTTGEVNDNFVDITGVIEFDYVGSSGANLTYASDIDLIGGAELTVQ